MKTDARFLELVDDFQEACIEYVSSGKTGEMDARRKAMIEHVAPLPCTTKPVASQNSGDLISKPSQAGRSEKSVESLLKPYTDAMAAIPREDVEPLLNALEKVYTTLELGGVREALAAFRAKHG